MVRKFYLKKKGGIDFQPLQQQFPNLSAYWNLLEGYEKTGCCPIPKDSDSEGSAFGKSPGDAAAGLGPTF